MKKNDLTPFSQKAVNRFLVLTIIFLALCAGYFHAKLNTEKNRYNYLQKSYYRIENKLIDLENEIEATKSGTTIRDDKEEL